MSFNNKIYVEENMKKVMVQLFVASMVIAGSVLPVLAAAGGGW